MSKEIFKEEKVFIQHDIEIKQLKEENWQLRKEESEKLRKKSEKLRKENEQLRSNNVAKNVKIKELIDSLEEDKSKTDYYPNWFDKKKFKNILAVIDGNTFNYRHKIGEFKYNDIKDFVNKIRNNTISEISAKKDLRTLNELKNVEIVKQKKNTLLNRKNY